MEVVHKIPYQLSSLSGSASQQYVLQDYAYDYALAGIPFLSGTQDNRAYTERMVEIRKQQFDNFAEPGEQSLDGWWLRSQSTFTGGAGILYQDPDNDNQFNYRFADSLGIDPWTAGEVKLLRRSFLDGSATGLPLKVQGYRDPSGADAYWRSAGPNLDKVTAALVTTVITGSGNVIFDISSTGSTYILARDNGVFKGSDAGAPSQLYSGTLTDGVVEFVKGRVALGTGPNFHANLTLAGPSAALPTTPTYTHQDASWRWRSISEGPNLVYAAGDSGSKSEIHKFGLTDPGTGVPELVWQGVTATLPLGEIVRDIYCYLGTFVGIATNKGFRVGQMSADGDIAYGPLLFTPEGGCGGIIGFDRFLWTGSTNAHDGQSGTFRVDLGNEVQEQTTRAVRYAYARDIYAEDEFAPITSLTMFGNSDQVVFAMQGIGSFRESSTLLLPSGYLETGRVRFNTEEPKLYKFFSVRMPSPLEGDVQVSLLTESGADINYFTFTPEVGAGTKDIATPQPAGPQNWVRLRFTLSAGANPALGGVLNGWQIKALPGSIRQRSITQSFQLFNEETDRTGQRKGYDDYARERFEAFKAVARAGDVILYQELQEDISTQVVIDDWEFRQLGPPGPNKGALGGYLTVVMRTVAESI